MNSSISSAKTLLSLPLENLAALEPELELARKHVTKSVIIARMACSIC